MNKLRVSAIVLCMMFLCGLLSVPLAIADWTMFRSDLSHTGAGTGNQTLGPTLLWKYTTANYDAVISSPTVANGVVFVGSGSGYIYAISSADGSKIWSYKTNDQVRSSPALVNGVLYVGSDDGNVYALDAASGSKLWSYKTQGSVFSCPAVSGGILYVGSDDGNVYALDAASGSKLWSYKTAGAVWSSPAVVEGIVYVGSNDGNVYALKADTGVKVWNYTTKFWNPVTGEFGDVFSSPSVVNGIVYVGSNSGALYALEASSGAKIWSYDTNGKVESSPAVVNGVVYVGSDDANIYAFEASSGIKLWNYTTHLELLGGIWSSPAVANGAVYIASMDGWVWAINTVDGTKLWNFFVNGFVFSSPTVADGILYIGSYDGNIYALGITNQQTTPTTPAPTTPAPTLTSEDRTSGIENVVTFNDWTTEMSSPFSIQQNFYVVSGDNSQTYWVQNGVMCDPELNVMNGGFEIYNFTAGAPDFPANKLVMWWFTANYAAEPARKEVILRSTIENNHVVMENTFHDSWTWDKNIVWDFELKEGSRIESNWPSIFMSPQLVIVGTPYPYQDVTFENPTSGRVDSYVRIGSSTGTWYYAENKVAQTSKETKETSLNLQWNENGDFQYLEEGTDQGLNFGFNEIYSAVSPPVIQFAAQSSAATIFALHCPAEMSIYDSSGRYVGLNVTTAKIDTEIPKSMFIPSGEEEYILVFDPSGTYNVTVTGTDSGTYILEQYSRTSLEINLLWSSTNATQQGKIDEYSFKITSEPNPLSTQLTIIMAIAVAVALVAVTLALIRRRRIRVPSPSSRMDFSQNAF